MPRSRRSRPTHLRVLPPPAATTGPWPPLPLMVPLLHPERAITPAEEVLFGMLAQRARQGDQAANRLLWRAFEARLEPIVRGCAGVTRQSTWPHRDGLPWLMEDVRQEAWVVFTDLTASWDGTGSYVPYITTHFAWRLRTAVRRLGPQRQTVSFIIVQDRAVTSPGHFAAEDLTLLDSIAARLSPADAMVLDMHVREGYGLGDIARHLGVSRRTITRRWQRVRDAAYQVLCPDRQGE